MQTTWLYLGSVAVRSPVTAGTNLLLAVQCGSYFFGLRKAAAERARLWGGFFLMMSIATCAGVLKHGAHHLVNARTLVLLLALSNLAGFVSTYYAQRAAITSHASERCQRGYFALAGTQAMGFVLANVLLGPDIGLLILNTLVGLPPVIAVEFTGRGSVRGAAQVARGLSLSILTGLVYLLHISAGPWLSHIDIAHLLMGLSFFVIHRGLTREGGAPWS